MIKAAPIYARMGWKLLPIEPGGKIPILKDWTNRATSDAPTLDEWIAAHPDANLGVATGSPSGFFVLDVDPRKGGNKSLAALLETHGELPPTVEAATPSGGSHYLFKMPAHEVSNSVDRIGRGLDIRGTGGQIVIAPSRRPEGAYEWVWPPWEYEIADAPQWLLDAARSAPAAAPGQVSADRGYFPAASPEVLDQARQRLARHGPAIQGDGGDHHTFRACALLTHDFALSDEESWPLLTEWNASCRPPWTERDLRAKLRGGGKYGSAPYGCKRTLDVCQTVKKWVADWDKSEDGLITMMERVRQLRVDDQTKRSFIVRDIKLVTGLSERDQRLPPVWVDDEPAEGQIVLTTRLHEVADQALRAIAPKVFQRSGILCEVVSADRTYIHEPDATRIRDLMSQSAEFVRPDKQGLVTVAAPEPVASILASRRGHQRVRVLEAITTAPVFLADGSILQTKGYNEQARLWLEPSVDVEVPDDATPADARRAVAALQDLLCDYKLSSPADFSAWVAGLLSPLVKAATGNAPAPLVCISASSPGAGKTLLTEVIARIVTGSSAEVRPYHSKDASEWGKRLTAFVKAASPVSVFDNVNGPIGDEGLDRLVTSSTWSDRILGASDAFPLPNVTTWFATGNNIEPINDTVRRVLMIRIEVDTERPQERTGFKYTLPDHAERMRSHYLSAALTILRAYHCAGRPAQALPSWGSFTVWSDLVRGALVWAGLPDPFETQRRCAADLTEPEHAAHDFWISIVEATDGSAPEIVKLCAQRDAGGVLGLRESISAHHLPRFLRRFVDKPRQGKRIRKQADRYYVERIS